MTVYEMIRWLVGTALGLLGCWILFTNFLAAYRLLARREPHSFVPLLGGFMASIGMTLCPMKGIQKLSWAPFTVDLGFFILRLIVGLACMLFSRGKAAPQKDGKGPQTQV
jgi:hypothetical protein